MRAEAWEVNFDGIVGPTHNYAGISYGNVASMEHGGSPSNPRKAALQGLRKMKLLADLGVKQGVLPPQERPDVTALRGLGFAGSDAQVIERAAREAPELLIACTSASSMWAANAATVSPSADTADGRVHFTPANLATQFHRSIEPSSTAVALAAIFPVGKHFVHHPPLPSGTSFADEGAANHLRLCPAHGCPGIEVFVFGRSAFRGTENGPRKFPARQTLEAAQALARRHRIPAERAVFARQDPKAIDKGVFHNDVIAVANENVLLCHARAFAGPEVLDEIRTKFARCAGAQPVVLAIDAEQLSVQRAVQTYLFNGQLVTVPEGGMAFIAPTECRGDPRAHRTIQRILDGDNPIGAVHYVNVRQSMRNGGGPACLRLRVVLTPAELRAAHPGVFLTDRLYEALRTWVEHHYRDRMQPKDLADPQLLVECREALDELSRILELGSIYRFQQSMCG